MNVDNLNHKSGRCNAAHRSLAKHTRTHTTTHIDKYTMVHTDMNLWKRKRKVKYDEWQGDGRERGMHLLDAWSRGIRSSIVFALVCRPILEYFTLQVCIHKYMY